MHHNKLTRQGAVEAIPCLGFSHSPSSHTSAKLLTEWWGGELGLSGWEAAYSSLIPCTPFSVSFLCAKYSWMQHKDKGRDNTWLKELPAEADSFQWGKWRSGSLLELSGQARNRKWTSSFWDSYVLHRVFLGKTQQVMIPFFVGCWNFWILLPQD